MKGEATRARTLAAVGAFVAIACDRELPPAGQILVHVDTDAVVREAEGTEPGPLALSPLVDRARFEVLRGGVPVPNTTRDVPVDAEMLRNRALSFGIVPPPSATDVSVRVRLFRADRVFGTEPDPGITLDTTVTLPPVTEDGIVDVAIVLKTEDFGVRIGHVPATAGTITRSVVGTWRGGKRVLCAERARENETCVPGAAFFFGNPQFRGRTPTNDVYEERLVTTSPFFIDASEVTVAAFRARWPELAARGVREPEKKEVDAFCTWTTAPEADNERRALNCMTWHTANAFCELIGKALPTEAQFELVSSGAGDELAYPWGNDEPTCAAAVWGCAGIATATREAIRRGADHCREERGGPGPQPPGQGLVDKVSSALLRNEGGADVQDVGGNLAEWARDVWARPTDPFWAGVRPMHDPMNSQPNGLDGEARPVRGGDWASTALTTRAGFRRQLAASDFSPLIGFRCARPAPAK